MTDDGGHILLLQWVRPCESAALREQARAAGEKMEEANIKAARAIFNHRNPPNAADAGGKIDLHGLRVEEAITILKEWLEMMIRKQQQQLKVVEVIAGAGHHSQRLALLRPKVRETLQELKMYFNEAMPGTFYVQLVAASRSPATWGTSSGASSYGRCYWCTAGCFVCFFQ
eukprot:GHVU01215823.1.p1 GENE.GHVU01215823.1~~GHVU01215823.1.p1  ORF type:complete len:171 (-),score=33.33 GHVU01215823.1:969-1481(-)